jgi:hypothetical protein
MGSKDTMSKIELSIPSFAKVKGSLYDTSDIRDLTQDMLEIELPGSLFIDVGWYPQWNPAGEYMILVFRDTVDNLLEKRIRNRDHREVAKIVGDLLVKYLSASRGSGNTVQVTAPVSYKTPTKTTTTTSPSRTTTTAGPDFISPDLSPPIRTTRPTPDLCLDFA